jgi:hypothetical protein
MRVIERTVEGINYLYYERQARDYDLLYVLPEFDVTGSCRPVTNNKPLYVWGLPPTVRFYDARNVPFYRFGEPNDCYKLLLELFTEACPSIWDADYVEKKMLGYLADGVCFTDHNHPTAWNPIVTCGNILYPTGKQMRTAGELYWEVRQLKAGSFSSMKLQLAQYPLLVTWATNSTRAYDGRCVEPFPQCGGNPVPAPLFCRSSTNWIRDARVRLLDRAEPVPALYYP